MYRRDRTLISLVILDLNMPVMDGKQCLEELLKINPELKILIASGFAIDTKMKRFPKERAAGFLRKPFKVRELLKAIHKALVNGSPKEQREMPTG